MAEETGRKTGMMELQTGTTGEICLQNENAVKSRATLFISGQTYLAVLLAWMLVYAGHIVGFLQRTIPYSSVFSVLPKHSSMLEFLTNKKKRVPDMPSISFSEPSCPKQSSCQPTKVAIERILLLQGVEEIAVIEECQCTSIPQECIRMPFLKTFFPDTPFESTVDVGKCSSPHVTEDNFKK